jgi:hypothetical protein
MAIRITLAIALSAVAAVCAADSPTYSITAHIVASGSSVHVASSCFGLDAVIAEPVAGFSAGGSFDLSAGFNYALPVINDTIFGNGFEDCSP